jgi:putative ABC transport system ATP-binding protein
VIELQDIGKTYRTDLIETHALRNVSLHFDPGQFVAITGPSGSGKTTLLNLLGLLEEVSSGTYRLDGADVSDLNDDQRSRIRNEKLGFVFQSFNLIPDFDVYDNVDVPLRYRRMARAERHQRITEALERVGLTSRMRHLPAQLSGGQQQRVAIARALAGGPRLILADEPTGNLDTEMSAQIMDLLQGINAAGTTIVMVTHNPDLARRAQRHVELVDGRVSELSDVAEHPRGALHATHGAAAPSGVA